MSVKTLLEQARGSFSKETPFTAEEEKALRADTRILDDSDEEIEHAENFQKQDWQTNLKANQRNDAEEGKSKDVVKDVWFRDEHKGQDDEIRMEPFHMRNERDDGYFDENEVYHLNKNEDSDDEFQKMLNEDQHNLEKIDNKDLTEKHKAKWEKDHEVFEQKKEDEDILQLHQDIFEILVHGETVSKALLRLGKYNKSGNKKRRLPQQDGKRKKRKKKKFAWDADSSEEEEENYTEEDKKKFKEQFEILSDRSNRLCSNAAMYQIYDMDKSECYRRIAQLNHHKVRFEKHKQQEAAKLNTAQQFKKDFESSSEDESDDDDGSESDSESTDEPQYEFKWLHDQTKIHTPYTLAKLKTWHQKKFFARGIVFRQIGTSEWKNSQEVDISSL